MHDTAMINAKMFVQTYLKDGTDIRLADIGAQNVTGSIKDICPANVQYTGVDFIDAKGVDVILKDPYHLPFEDGTFDIVTASSCLEHSEFFWDLFLEMLRIVKNDGLIYINAPSNGRYHRYPVDCWRFYPDSGLALSNYGNKKGYNCSLMESYTSNQIKLWNDFVCIIIKDKAHAGIYKNRITDSFKKYTNGRSLECTNNGHTLKKSNECEAPEDQRFIGWKINKFLLRLIARA